MLMPSRKTVTLIFLSLALVANFAWADKASTSEAAEPASFEDALLSSLKWREVGPYRGGRSAAVAGIPQQRETYYFGATGGGVWKTTDGGTSWSNVSDGFFGGSIGAVAVSAWDPNVIYAGGGEKTVRGNVSHGDGVWKSTDAGKTWNSVGLRDSRHIPRIQIHPKDPNHVYVAALGHLFGPNEERGVYRSLDGGATWQRILFVNENAGAVDLAMDPTNPRILYASFWRVRRTPYSLESGGEGSGLWKSTDGGDHWQELFSNPGLPEGPLGISGIAVSHTQPENLYAMIEAEKGGVFRSRDGGATWQKTNSQRDLRQRAWYYTRIYADPADEEGVYVLNVRFHHSKDGGKTFRQILTPHGDNHDLWIDPGDPARMIEANDGGANVSYDGGKTWSAQNNQPTAQMYRVSTDNAFPYRLLGGQQDNTAVRIRSRSAFGSAIGVRDWEPTAGGESGYIVAKPDDPDTVYGGSYGGLLTRFDHRTGQRQAVNVWPDDPMGWGAAELTYRFQWNFPIFFSPHNPDRIYAAANVLFKSDDSGHRWTAISPDLTRNDPSTLGPSGGPITKDNTSVEYYGTIFAALESPQEPGVLWAGSDDGLLHLSRNGGETWQNVTPKGLPEWMQINSIEPHPFEPGGLYMAGTRYKSDDFAPYLYKTEDYGNTWRKITKGIDPLHFTRVIRADPDRRGLLYAGTENGVYVSWNDGKQWRQLEGHLPIVPITDLAVKEQDLIAATQGRGYWILDDLSPLHQFQPDLSSEAIHFFAPRPAYRLHNRHSDEPGNRGTNPYPGVAFRFWLAEEPAPETNLQLEIFEQDIEGQAGRLIRQWTPKPKGEDNSDKPEDNQEESSALIEVQQGMVQFHWDLRYPAAEKFPGLVIWNRRLDGPLAVPGNYRARLTVGEWQKEVPFQILPDPRSAAEPDDYRAQLDFLLEVRDRLTHIHQEIRKIRQVKKQLQELATHLDSREPLKPLLDAGNELEEKLSEVEKALYQTQNQSPQDPLNFPIRLNDKLSALAQLAGHGDFRPTESMIAVFEELAQAIDRQMETLNFLWEEDLPAFNTLAQDHQAPAIFLPPDV